MSKSLDLSAPLLVTCNGEELFKLYLFSTVCVSPFPDGLRGLVSESLWVEKPRWSCGPDGAGHCTQCEILARGSSQERGSEEQAAESDVNSCRGTPQYRQRQPPDPLVPSFGKGKWPPLAEH